METVELEVPEFVELLDLLRGVDPVVPPLPSEVGESLGGVESPDEVELELDEVAMITPMMAPITAQSTTTPMMTRRLLTAIVLLPQWRFADPYEVVRGLAAIIGVDYI